jgi:DNA-binding transcriptional MocR family regulator
MIPDTERLYRYLVRRVGRAGSIPSQTTIATDLGWSTRTVQRRLAELKQRGWLDSDRRVRRGAHGGGKLRGGNAYYPKVDLPDLEPQVSDHMPWSNRAATVTESVSAGQTETTAERADPRTPYGKEAG